jgi:phosphatidylglycerol:prolipoprotein diacylglycerol transferase
MHPVMFEIPTPWGGQLVYSYGLLLGLSLIAGWFLLMRLGIRRGVDADRLANTFLVGVASALVGSRLLFVIAHLEMFASAAQWFDVRTGGLSTEGAWLGGFAGSALYLRLKRAPVLPVADAASPGLALGLLLTRIGNYLHGSDFGTRLGEGAPAWLRRLGTFPRWEDPYAHLQGSPAWRLHVREHDLPPEAASAFPVHPTQLYEALCALGLLGLVWLIYRRRQFEGQAFLALVWAYGLAKLLLDPLVEDPERTRLFDFTLGQLLAMLSMAVASLVWTDRRKRARQDVAWQPALPLKR